MSTGSGTAARAQAQLMPPLHEAMQSVRVLRDETLLYQAPDHESPRRGSVSRGTRLRILKRVAGPGCDNDVWYQVGPHAFVCGARVRLSHLAPVGKSLLRVRKGRVLPHTYAFVQQDETPVYSHPNEALVDNYLSTFEKGFGLLITGGEQIDDLHLLRTRDNQWVARDAMGFVGGSRFAGTAIDVNAPLDLAWVIAHRARLYDAPDGKVLERLKRHSLVHVRQVQEDWAELSDGRWLRLKRIRRASLSAPPAGIGAQERWIDVSISEQVLVAYEGTRPVYATLVSTGKRKRDYRTPVGEHRIWGKLAYSDMSDRDDDSLEKHYYIQGVPWVQYFQESFGLHAAFWHHGFGQPRSHGCVNLSPRDAAYLFDFTQPVLPDGWHAIFPTSEEKGTLIRIRE